MKIKFSIFLIVMTGAVCFVRAQTGNLEFIQNRGQWNSTIQYRADLPNASFFLQQHGFSVLLQRVADMDALRKRIHGTASYDHSGNPAVTESNNTSPALSASSNKKTGHNNPDNDISNSGSTPLLMHSHMYQVEFVNSSAAVEITGDKPLNTYNNYFIGNDSSSWRSNCKIYQAIIYKNLYPGIDLRYYTENNQLKYDLIVHPGANPAEIVMKYTGADKLIIRPEKITVQTSAGEVNEEIPHTYQFSKTGNHDLECTYVAGSDNNIHFKMGNYDAGATLIIDPSLVFSSFTGSHSDNWGYTATYDQAGNFYSGSITLNSFDDGSGFPSSLGAYQSVFQGGNPTDDGKWQYDITIMKFSSDGVNRLYATYIGGSGNEQPHSLVVDASNNLVIAGRTSSPNFPNVNSTKIKDTLHGGYDIILTKLNSSGTSLIGSRIIGGKSDDGVNIAPKYSASPIPMGQHSLRLNYGDDGRSEVILDKSGNVYLASCTASADFPVTANAFQKTIGGQQDGVFIKTNPDLSIVLASSFLGGKNDDAAFVLALNPLSNTIYIGGGTVSTDFPGTGNGTVLQKTNSGGIDGFLSMVSNDGGTLIKTSYFGTAGTEVIYGVQFDNAGFPYIMGTTTGKWPVINAAFSQANGKQFISKLLPDISAYVYSTVFGKGSTFPDISPTAFLVDRCENIYVAGWGGGIEREGTGNGQSVAVYENSNTSGLTPFGNPLKATTDGNDFYFFVMKKDAAGQLYGSFYGQTNGRAGDHVDGGTSRFDKQGVIYEAVCANCFGGDFPSTPNAWATRNGTGTRGCNLAAVKISFDFAGVAADPKSFINGRYDSSGCVPLDVLFKDTIHNAKTYVWHFDDGSPDTSTTVSQVMHTFFSVGNYTVRLIAIDSTTCNIADTAYLRIRVRTDRAILDFDIAKQPPCASLSYLFTNTSIPPAGKTFKPADFLWNFGDGSTAAGIGPVQHAYTGSGTYIVQLILSDTNFCNSPDTLFKTLRVSPVVKAQFEVPDGCAPYDAFFRNTSLGGLSFEWTFGDNSGSILTDPEHLFPDTGSYTVTLLAIDSTSCNLQNSITKIVRVDPKPTADFYFLPVPSEYNTPTQFFNTSTGASRYIWFFGDGDSTVKDSTVMVTHQFQQTKTFTVCLIAINPFECADTVCHPVESLINPLLDVPNAFTPGRFGENGIVLVKGFGIATMDWKIYNRWGQVVFESNNPFIGWDGTYHGATQPMDVYGYTLEAVFFDGTKARKTGDITLIR